MTPESLPATKPILEKEWVGCLLCGSQRHETYLRALPGVVKCSDCALVYANPRLKKEALADFYSKEYFESHSSEKMGYDNYVSDKELVEKTFQRRLANIEKKWSRGKGRVLDVGCATGFFLTIARERGWEPNGVEISGYCCEYALREFNLKIQQGFFKELPMQAGFKLVTMWDYIEHSFTPDEDIRKAWELLEPGGLLALATPDAASLPAKFFKENWMGFKEHEHLYYFTAQNLTGLLKKTGFEILSTSYTGKYISPVFFARRLAGYFKFLGGAASGLASGAIFKNANFYCNPFDIVYVVARKPAS